MVQPLSVSGMVRRGKLSGVECGGIDNESRFSQFSGYVSKTR